MQACDPHLACEHQLLPGAFLPRCPWCVWFWVSGTRWRMTAPAVKSGLFLAREDPLLQEQWNVHSGLLLWLWWGILGYNHQQFMSWCLPCRGKAKSERTGDTSTAINALWCSNAQREYFKGTDSWQSRGPDARGLIWKACVFNIAAHVFPQVSLGKGIAHFPQDSSMHFLFLIKIYSLGKCCLIKQQEKGVCSLQ